MCLFINVNSKNSDKYFSNLAFLFLRYRNVLVDDFKNNQLEKIGYFQFLKSFIYSIQPFFWIIIDKNSKEFAGFVYLDNFTGDKNQLHCAEITGCIEQKFRGQFAQKAAKFFFKYCLQDLGLSKIKAQIYPQNYCVKALLIKSGFKKEGLLKAETLKNGHLQDIEVYGLVKNEYERINNEN